MSTEVAAWPCRRRGSSRRCGGSRSCPRYNEERNVGRVIDELRAFDPGLEIVVVSDGSTDRTAEVAAAHGAHVLRLPFNLGIGGAVQTGFRYACEERLRARRARRRRRPARPGAARRGGRARARRRGRHRRRLALRSAPAATGRRPPRRVGIRMLAWVVSRDRAPARHRHDVGLPGAEPPRDRALRRRLPARLPRGRGARDGDPAPAAAERGAGDDARARARPLVDHGARLGLLHGQGAARALRRPVPPQRRPAGGLA